MERQCAGPPLKGGQDALASFITSRGVPSIEPNWHPLIAHCNNGAVINMVPAISQNGRVERPRSAGTKHVVGLPIYCPTYKNIN